MLDSANGTPITLSIRYLLTSAHCALLPPRACSLRKKEMEEEDAKKLVGAKSGAVAPEAAAKEEAAA